MQLSLNFSPGLTAQFRSIGEVCAAAVYASRKGLSGVAGDLDMAPSDLQRRLNLVDDQRPLTVSHLVGIVESTADARPVYWLIERFLKDPESARLDAIAQLGAIMPTLTALVEQASKRK